jgi:PAS domain S-box-containing protein
MGKKKLNIAAGQNKKLKSDKNPERQSAETTDFNKAEDTLEGSKIPYKTLFRSLPLSTTIFKKKGKDFIIIDFNDAADEFTNKRMSGFVGKAAGELYLDHPEILEKFELAFKQRTKQTYQSHYEKRSTGEQIYLNLTLAFSPPDLVIMHSEDISKQKITESELQKSETLFKTTFENSSVAMTITSLNGELLRVNHAFCDLTGYSEQELKGMQFLQFTHPHDLEKNLEGFEKLKRGELKTFRMEKRYFRRNGKIIWVDMSAVIVEDEAGKANYIVTNIQDINERKEAEQNIKESERKYRELINNARSLIIKMDTEGRITFINEYAQGLFGYREDEIIGKMAIGTIVPEIESTGRDLTSMVDNIIKDPDEFQVNLNENIKRNGEHIWVEWHNRALSDNNGIHIGHIAVGIDVTKRMIAEGKIIDNQKTFSELIERAPFGIYIIDSAFCIANMNKSSQTGSFRNVHPVIGRDFSEAMHILWPSIVAEEIISHFRHTLDTGESFYSPRFTNLRNDILSIESYEWELHRMTLPDGQYGVICYYFDSTDLRNAQDSLRESQDKLDIALENAKIGLWEWNLKTNELIWDRRTESIFGFDPGKFDKKYETFENSINEEDLPHVMNSIDQTLKSDIPLETIFRTKSVNGVYKHVSAKAILKKDKAGSPVSLSGVCFDVTGMKKSTEQTIIKLNEELLRSNKDLQQFAYVASHDLQEPLRMVSSFTQMLAKRYNDKLDQEARDYIKFAVDGSKRMYELLNSLLAYSRIQTKGREFAEVDLNIVLEKVQKNLSLRIEDRQAKINIKKLPVISGDEAQMIQLFQNLLENGIKFNPNTPSIIISSKAKFDNIIFSVKDNGIGIEPQYFEKIFQIFQRLHPREEYYGTGIGLAICKRIVERHGGTIWVESEIGKSTTFLFSIPKTRSFRSPR